MPIPATLGGSISRSQQVATELLYERPRPAPPPAGTTVVLTVGALTGYIHAVGLRDVTEGVTAVIASRTPGLDYAAGVLAPGGWVRFDVVGGPLPITEEERIRVIVTCTGAAWPRMIVLWEPLDTTDPVP